ncbi:MAG: helix-turn-helix transcriptional regulator [Chitinophagaceae bacterium]
MSFGKRLADARKKKDISQDELAKLLITKGPVIGRYERDEMKPSIEVAAKMADILEVSLDYLVGKADEHLDKSTLTRILEVQKLPTEKKNFVLNMIDMALRDFKVKQAHAS